MQLVVSYSISIVSGKEKGNIHLLHPLFTAQGSKELLLSRLQEKALGEKELTKLNSLSFYSSLQLQL